MLNQELFAVAENEAGAVGTRQLAGTAELTRVAANTTEKVMHAINDDADKYEESLKEAMVDAEALDNLIDELGDIDSIDTESLTGLDEETVNSMLKSQQSKRSRCKSKPMTLDNFKSMMTAAIAEKLLRLVYDKPKSHFGPRSSSLEVTDEMLEAFKDDQEALGRAIRNIQSKKSIEKAKEDFSEDSERWQQLLEAEARLKSVRVAGGSAVKSKIRELIGDTDIDSLKANDAKDLLKSISEMVKPVETEEATESEEADEQIDG